MATVTESPSRRAQSLITVCDPGVPAGSTIGALMDTAVALRTGVPASTDAACAIASSTIAGGSTGTPSTW